MTLDQAISICRSDPEYAGSMVMKLIAQNTDALPGTAFVRRGAPPHELCIKKVRITATLTESEGHIMKTQSGRFDALIGGIRKINEYVSLDVIKPSKVMVDGREQMNPYIQIHPATRLPEVVYCRTLAVGYSRMGSLNATDVMVRLDLNIYLLENFQSKIKKLGDHSGRLGEYGSENQQPVDDGNKTRPGRWRFFPLHSVGGIGLWVNTAAPEFADIMRDHTTRLKYIERLAQSFAERNACKAHPAFPKSFNVSNGVARVTLDTWVTDFDRRELETLRQMIEENKIDEYKDEQGRGVSVQAVDVTQADEVDRQSMDDVAASESGAEGGGEGEGEGDGAGDGAGEGAGDSVDLLAQASELFSKLVELKNRSAANKVKSSPPCGIEGVLEEASTEQLQAFIAAATTEINKASK